MVFLLQSCGRPSTASGSARDDHDAALVTATGGGGRPGYAIIQLAPSAAPSRCAAPQRSAAVATAASTAARRVVRSPAPAASSPGLITAPAAARALVIWLLVDMALTQEP
jgi:hypothetical protein